jgi:hypothetical protein
VARNPLRVAAAQGQRDNVDLAALFARIIGTSDHPRGDLLSEYRQARRLIAQILKAGGPGLQQQAAEILANLERNVGAIIVAGIREAADLGRASADKQVAAYVADGVSVRTASEAANLAPVVDAVRATIETQVRQVRALLATGEPPEIIIGDETRLGALQPGPVGQELGRYLAAAQSLGMEAWLVGRDGRLAGEVEFQRQAIAAIDQVTTDCCLRVHGQVVGLDEEFHLTGTPRFADRIMRPPFHWWCRTSTALYRAFYEDGLTGEMRDAARAELDARAAAQTKIDHYKEELAKRGAATDVRIRKDDPAEIKELRRQLRIWRNRLREPIWPSHARSRRNYTEPFVG